MQNIINSTIQNITFKNRSFLIKRDDLLHKDFSGNKARKLHYFLDNEFNNIKKLVSFGSNQSNAMYSLSVLANLKDWDFEYYVDHIPELLKKNPNGNYKYAIDNGMVIKLHSFKMAADILRDDVLFISEGGAVSEAAYGIEILANEIKEYQKENNLKNLKVFLPSGTGTTALFLQKFLDIEVLTCPCVGDKEYLKQQFLELESDETIHPTILKTKKKYHFGKLYKNNYFLWEELKKETNIEFDLLYDPIGWETLLNYDNIDNSTILYIHQGGLLGNETMVERYKYKYSSTIH
ncbi:MAG: 1-aminocyclopropane-1-carboxylate deaminase [Campylobacterota bacterium]|nr:1-aminocyclopropane-1-carboxylate deaminase [Campylobacterota bacterium]